MTQMQLLDSVLTEIYKNGVRPLATHLNWFGMNPPRRYAEWLGKKKNSRYYKMIYAVDKNPVSEDTLNKLKQKFNNYEDDYIKITNIKFYSGRSYFAGGYAYSCMIDYIIK